MMAGGREVRSANLSEAVVAVGESGRDHGPGLSSRVKANEARNGSIRQATEEWKEHDRVGEGNGATGVL